MSMNNKQRWMGGVVLLGGGVLLAALLLKGKEELHQKQVQTPPVAQVQQQSKAVGQAVQLQPLTVDVATEKRLLEEQKRSRERAVAEQEAKAAEFLRMQQQAEAEAARKAAEEYAAMNARRGAKAQEGTDIPPEINQDDKNKTQQQKDAAAKKLSEQKRLAAEAEQKSAEEKKRKAQEDARKKAEALKAEAERKKTDAQKAEAERKKAAELKAAEQKAAEQKKQREKEEARKKAEADKARKLLEDGDTGNKQWMVQVALAANEANADAVAAKLRAKGYKVTQSPTSKGIRIMVGPAKDRETADSTRKRINGDASLGLKSAWVIDWVPLNQR